jgi:transcriptional regulator
VRGPQHGYGIAVHIQQVSNEALRVEEGSLYPALHRIEQEGWIRAEWGLSENNRRAKFYEITAAGKRQLAAEEKKWASLTAGVASVMRYA